MSDIISIRPEDMRDEKRISHQLTQILKQLEKKIITEDRVKQIVLSMKKAGEI